MVVTFACKNDEPHDFTIEDNVIKGRVSPCEFEDYNVGKMILDALNSEPEHIGQIDANTGERTTFLEMKSRSVQCALWLRELGIGPNDVVTVCTNNQMDDYVPVLATFYVGAIYNPWYYGIELPEARRLISLLRPRVIFACESALDVLLTAAAEVRANTKIVPLDRNCRLLSLGDALAAGRYGPRDVESFECISPEAPTSPAVVTMSSGTGGTAKCVELSAGSVARYFRRSRSSPKSGRKVCLWYGSMHWYCGTVHFLQSIVDRNTRVLHDSYDHEDVCRVIEKFKVEVLVLPVSLIVDLLRHNIFDSYDLSSLKVISVGGSHLNRDLIKKLETRLPNVHIDNSYGLTEVGSRCNEPGRRRTKLGSIGFIKSNTQMKVVDPRSGETLGPNLTGELCFKCDTAMTGYYGDPEATKQTIDDQGWVRSGDLGYYDETGEIVLTERLGEMMRYRDKDVSPSEIEETLLGHPEVIEACVVPVPHATDNHHPMAFVRRRSNAKVTEEELMSFSSKLGDSKKLRGGIKFIDKMPRTDTGAIHRKCLKEMAKVHALL